MAENLLSKFNLDGTEITIVDTKARADVSNAVSTANTAISTANTAISTANSAQATAVKKALITYDNSTQTMLIKQGGK